MNLAIEPLIHLLHQAAHGSLATHSQHLPGYPFLSVLPFVPDEHHCPIFLISGLAEHTRNLIADPRASLLLLEPGASEMQAGSRLTVVGNLEPFEPPPALVDRYRRYQPTAERLLQFPDFRFFRLQPYRLRFIEGFGQMGWMDGSTLHGGPELAPTVEIRLLAEFAVQLPEAMQLLGIDRYGLDLTVAGNRQRVLFSSAPLPEDRIAEAVLSAIQSLNTT